LNLRFKLQRIFYNQLLSIQQLYVIHFFQLDFLPLTNPSRNNCSSPQ